MTRLFKPFRSNTSGATLIEFSFVFPLLLIMTFGIVEFGYVLYQYNSAQKATQAGARAASTRLILEGVSDCFVNTTATAGTDCADTGALSWGGVTCTGTTGTTNCNSAGLTSVLNEMQLYYPQVQAANLEVDFGPTGLGYVGRGAPVPSITVRLVNLDYDFIAMGALVKYFDNSSSFGNSINITTAETTIVGEDMGEGA